MAAMEKLDIRLKVETIGGLDVLATKYKRQRSEIALFMIEMVLSDNKLIEKSLK